MKFVTYTTKVHGEAQVGILAKERVYPIGCPCMNEWIRGYDPQTALRAMEGTGIPLSDVKLLAPIPHPVHDLLCLGMNYEKHAIECCQARVSKVEIPQNPVYFSKRVDRAVGPEEPILSHSDFVQMLDYEAELAVVIGKRCSHVSEAEAYDYVFGYTAANDVSARDLQRRHVQFTFAKGLDGFAVLGPCLVTADEFRRGPDVQIVCRVNGEERQNDNSANMIFSIPYIISELSRGITLEPGDIILTGTPNGVGMGCNPPKFLLPGDEVEIEVEGIGLLRNTVR